MFIGLVTVLAVWQQLAGIRVVFQMFLSSLLQCGFRLIGLTIWRQPSATRTFLFFFVCANGLLLIVLAVLPRAMAI